MYRTLLGHCYIPSVYPGNFLLHFHLVICSFFLQCVEWMLIIYVVHCFLNIKLCILILFKRVFVKGSVWLFLVLF